MYNLWCTYTLTHTFCYNLQYVYMKECFDRVFEEKEQEYAVGRL